VVTPCLNAAFTITDTIHSVEKANQCLNAKGLQIEHIIVEGGSTDGTITLISEKMKIYPYLRCVKDQGKGIYAAMNTGLEEAKGKFTHILNADDMILDPVKYAELLMAGIECKAEAILCSIVYFKRPSRKMTRQWILQPISQKNSNWEHQLRRGLHYPHPGFIANTTLYKTEGFDTRFRLSADYKLMQSILLKEGMSKRTTINKDIIIAMAEGGATSGYKSTLEGWLQLKRINKELGINSFGISRYLRKIAAKYLLVRTKGIVPIY
jgi:glycosyltransferase involved in cell wall biosynthesis